MFRLIRGYTHCKKTGAPMHLYWKWFRAKSVIDLRIIGWVLLFSPFIIIRIFGLIVNVCCELLTEWVPPMPQDKKAQTDAASEYHKWLRVHDLMHTLKTGKKFK